MRSKRKARPKANGVIVHEDPKRVVIATGISRKSANAKTGPMVQVWILVKSRNPLEAVATGKHVLVCGTCPLPGVCYVDLGKAPLNIWRTWQRGGYPKLTDYTVFSGKRVRFGAYGDPAFIPFPIVKAIAEASDGWTGYTHQWRNPLYQGLRGYVMASVETEDGAAQAHSMGWRTFRVASTLDTKANEIVCPNTTRGVQCIDCRLCAGTSKQAKSILIAAHGQGKNKLQEAAGR